jgi:DNA excision repair protein ERCC-4
MAPRKLENKDHRRGSRHPPPNSTVPSPDALSEGSYLLTYDAVSFNQLLETVLITNTPAPGSTRQNHSPWLFLDPAQVIFSTAKDRVYIKDEEEENGIKVVYEELPKWETLKEVLDEIEHEIHLAPKTGSSNRDVADVDDGTNAVVVMCTDEGTCRQLREYLESVGTDRMMKRKLNDYFQWKSNFHKTRDQLFQKKKEENADDGILL